MLKYDPRGYPPIRIELLGALEWAAEKRWRPCTDLDDIMCDHYQAAAEGAVPRIADGIARRLLVWWQSAPWIMRSGWMSLVGRTLARDERRIAFRLANALTRISPAEAARRLGTSLGYLRLIVSGHTAGFGGRIADRIDSGYLDVPPGGPADETPYGHFGGA